jgi:hypothetical protein
VIKINHPGPVNPGRLKEELEALHSGRFTDKVIAYGEEGVVYVYDVTEDDRADIEAALTKHDHTQQTQAERDTTAVVVRRNLAKARIKDLDIEAEKATANAPWAVAIWNAIADLRTVLGIEGEA